MTAVAPMPIIAPGSADIGRPGQQLLPGYVVKLLKTLKIPFGTDRTMNGVDVDPSINLIGHIIDCLGALRDVNKVYRAKGSLASRSVGTRTMFGFTAELGNILLDAITFDPPNDLSDSSLYYGQVATSILNVFPEIAAQVTPSTGKVLIHHTALKASATMAMEAIKMVIKAFPAGAWTTDRTGALPLHWITHNSSCTSDMINYLINANPKGPWVADCDGYLPLHWAVNQDMPNIDVVAALIAANVSASAKACLKGSLPLHWCVNRDVPNMAVLRALLQVHADGVRTFDKTGWLPLHQCVNRSNISLDALSLLIELYPQGLQCPNVNGQLPLHRALDQLSPSVEAIHMMLEAFPGGSKVADDEGYLPIHLALDCARPNPVIAKMLLDHYPESAFHKSKDGLLPIHCIISSMNPVVEIIQSLLVIFPDSTESMAVDVIPVDEAADPETWTGEWIEKRWTPLSRAIDRGLDAIVILFRDALNASKNYAMVTNQQQGQGGAGGAPSASGGSKLNTATPKTLMPQSKPPINNLTGAAFAPSPSIQRGPSTSSNEGINAGGNRLVLGGNLDSPSRNNEGANEDDFGFDPNIGEYTGGAQHHQPPQGSPPQGRTLPVNVNHNMSGHNLREGSTGPLSHRPSTGGPPGYGPPSLKDRGPVARGDKHAEAKHRERERQSSRDRERDRDRDRDRERDRRDDRDRERDRDGDRRRHRSSSRNHRSSDRGGDYYDDDRDRDRERHHRDRSSNRSSSKDRRSSRDSDRDRERDREKRGHRQPAQPRIYEQTDYDDYNNNDPQNYEENPNEGGGQQRQPQYDEDRQQQQSAKMRMMNAPIGPPTSAPPRSMVEAANRPGTRRGPDDMPVPNNNNYVGGNQINHSHSGSREHYSRDNSNELGEYIDQAVVDIHNGHERLPQRPLSIDDIV